MKKFSEAASQGFARVACWAIHQPQTQQNSQYFGTCFDANIRMISRTGITETWRNWVNRVNWGCRPKVQNSNACLAALVLLVSNTPRSEGHRTKVLYIKYEIASHAFFITDDSKLMSSFPTRRRKFKHNCRGALTDDWWNAWLVPIFNIKWKSWLSTSAMINTVTISNINKECPNVQHLSKANQSKSGIYDFERSGHVWTTLPRHSESFKHVNHYDPTWWLSGCGSASEMLSLHICAVSAMLWQSFCRSESSCTFPWQQQNLGRRNRKCANMFIQIIKWKNVKNKPKQLSWFDKLLCTALSSLVFAKQIQTVLKDTSQASCKGGKNSGIDIMTLWSQSMIQETHETSRWQQRRQECLLLYQSQQSPQSKLLTRADSPTSRITTITTCCGVE